MPDASSPLPLTGLRVLDLSRYLPGAYATLVMADLGAQVDRLEAPEGDPLRKMPPYVGDQSAYFYGLNRNKRSLVLDLKTPQGVETFKQLLPRYDVLVENHRPGVMARLGLSPELLLTLHPGLILCSLTGFGQTGPDRGRAGHDLNYVARGGLLGSTGPKDAAPPLLGAQAADLGGGSLFALVGILAALRDRDRTGRGRHLDLSLTDGTVALQHMSVAARLALGEDGDVLARGSGLLGGEVPSYGVYGTQDGRYLAVSSLETKFLHRLLDALGLPRTLGPPEGTPEQRAAFRSAVAEAISQRSLVYWTERFATLDACVEPVLEGDEILHDAQLMSRGLYFTVRDPALGRDVGQLRSPLDFGPVPRRPPPALGQHTQEILSEAGLVATASAREG